MSGFVVIGDVVGWIWCEIVLVEEVGIRVWVVGFLFSRLGVVKK
jgi:hypothetical protein